MKEKRILAALGFEADWERQILAGLIAYARENDLNWEIRAVSRGTGLSELMQRFRPHGLLYHPHMPLTAPLPPDLATVFLDWKDSPKRPLLLIDDRQIGQLAAEHFLAHGLTQFCFAGNLNRPYARVRRDGFAGQLRRAGYSAAEFNTEGYFLGLLNSWDNPELTGRFVDQINRLSKPLALFAVDDFEAYTVFELCLKYRWDIPDQIRILGVNNEELVCRACDPMLSSIRIPYRQIGLKAAELLYRQFLGESTPGKPVVFQASEVVIRRSTAVDRIDDPAVAAAVRFIREHYKENITTDALIELTGISRSMLERRFKQAVNRTPYFEILNHRIEQSKRLLRDTRLTVQKIAGGCGFNSSTRFCRAFKEKTGMSPLQYRQSCKTI